MRDAAETIRALSRMMRRLETRMTQSTTYGPVSVQQLSIKSTVYACAYVWSTTRRAACQQCGMHGQTTGFHVENIIWPFVESSSCLGRQPTNQFRVTSTRQLRSRKQPFEFSPRKVRGVSGQYEEARLSKECVDVVVALCAACRLVATPQACPVSRDD